MGSPLGTSGEGLITASGPAMTSCSENGTYEGVPFGLSDVWLKYFVEADAEWDGET
jgi:hypothetical protein